MDTSAEKMYKEELNSLFALTDGDIQFTGRICDMTNRPISAGDHVYVYLDKTSGQWWATRTATEAARVPFDGEERDDGMLRAEVLCKTFDNENQPEEFKHSGYRLNVSTEFLGLQLIRIEDVVRM